MSRLQAESPATEGRLSPGRQPRGREGQSTPGRCGNLDYCSIGMQRVLVQVPLDAKFVCPECGGALRAPRRMARAGGPIVLPLLRIAVLVAGMAASLAVGYLLGRVQPVVRHAVSAASKAATLKLDTARTMMGLQTPPASAPTPALAPPAPKAAPPVQIAEIPTPARLAPVDILHPPAHLRHEARFGQVTIDCAIGVLDAKPTCRLADIRGANTLADAALGWLNGISVQYAQSPSGAAPGLLDHRWRVIIEDYSGTAGSTAR